MLNGALQLDFKKCSCLRANGMQESATANACAYDMLNDFWREREGVRERKSAFVCEE